MKDGGSQVDGAKFEILEGFLWLSVLLYNFPNGYEYELFLYFGIYVILYKLNKN